MLALALQSTYDPGHNIRRGLRASERAPAGELKLQGSSAHDIAYARLQQVIEVILVSKHATALPKGHLLGN